MKIIAIEKNYLMHNKTSLITLKEKESPLVYSKADSSLLKDGKPLFIPDFTQRCTAAVELVVRISRLGKCISQKFASRYYDAVTIGVSFEAADKMEECRKQGRPWDLYQSFDGASAIGTFIETDKLMSSDFSIRLTTDGNTVQQGRTKDLIWRIDELIEYISQYYTLRQGDLLFTGYPVEPTEVKIEQHIEGYLDNQKLLDFNVK